MAESLPKLLPMRNSPRTRRSCPMTLALKGKKGLTDLFISSLLIFILLVACGVGAATLSEPCPTNNTLTGYATLESFLLDWENETITEFHLCPVLNFTTTSDTVPSFFRVNASSSSPQIRYIRCASGGGEHCIWDSNSDVHMWIQPPQGYFDLVVEGILFRSANETSIWIEAPEDDNNSDTPLPVSINFTNCAWESNFGSATVVIRGSVDESTISSEQVSFADTRVVVDHGLFVSNSARESIIIHEAGELFVFDTDFQSNAPNKQVISTASGGSTGNIPQLSLNSASFENHTVSLGVISIAATGTFNLTNVCGDYNVATQLCNGTYLEVLDPVRCVDTFEADACAPACIEFESCSGNNTGRDDFDNSTMCFSTWKDLASAIENVTASGEAGEVDLCYGSNLIADAPIEFTTTSDLTLRCFKNESLLKANTSNCTITGGDSGHFRILDPLGSVAIQGIHFDLASSTSSVVEIQMNPAIESHVYMMDCVFSSIEAEAVITLLATSTQLATQNSHIGNGTVVLKDSIFLQNNVSEHVIRNDGLNLTLDGVVATGNQALGSVIGTIVGRTHSTSIRVADNVVGQGTIFVGLDGHAVNEEICGAGNLAGGGNPCNGTFYQVLDPDGCAADNGNATLCSSACFLIDDSCFSRIGTDCYTDWEALLTAAEEAAKGDILTVCANTTFELDETSPPLILRESSVVLKCGASEFAQNGCVISGGRSQIEIFGDPSDIQITGFEFRTSTAVAIGTFGDSTASAQISLCTFRNHEGAAVILNLNGANSTTEDFGNLDLSSIEGSSMTVGIDACTFEDNILSLSPVVNLGGDVTVQKSEFDRNKGLAGAILAILVGNLAVDDSCFRDNSGSVVGAVLLQEGAILSSQQSNYGDGNEVLPGTCTDVLADGDCQSFSLDECGGLELLDSLSPSAATPEPTSSPTKSSAPSRAPIPCLSDWDTLYASVSSTVGDDSFVICRNTVFDLTALEGEGRAPLKIARDNVRILCETSHSTCHFQGGTKHIEMEGSVTNVFISGISFRNATEVSIWAEIRAPFFVEFESCEWRGNTGDATVLVQTLGNGTDPSGDDIFSDDILAGGDDVTDEDAPTSFPVVGSSSDDELVGGRFLADTQTRAFVCDRCLFESNSASDGVIVASGVDTTLDAVEFGDNQVSGSVVDVQDGFVYVTSSCLIGNEASSGLITNNDETQVVSENNFVENNVQSGADGCEGIFDGTTCNTFDGSLCLATTRRCFNDWNQLSQSIAAASTVGQGGRFALCEDSIVDVTNQDPIVIDQSNTIIQCGFAATSQDNCQVQGGEVQFVVSGTPVDVEFRGITFTGATNVAIHGAASRGGRALLDDCIFRNNAGTASVLLFDGALPALATTPTSRVTIEDFQPPPDRAMGITVEFCEFQQNDVDLAPLAVLGGTATISNSQFDRNSGSAGGVAVWFDGGIVLQDSCFTENDGELAGVAFASEISLVSQSNNFGEGNTVAVTSSNNCTDLLLEGGCESEGNCNGLCLEFDLNECIPVPQPTSAPTLAPTPNPAVPAIPNFDPTDRPTAGDFTCYSNWTELSTVIDDAASSPGIEVVYSLCPDTVFDVTGEEPIVIDEGDVLVQCGRNGELDDNCTIFGGDIQFRIEQSPSSVTFAGIHFTEAALVNVVAGANNGASIASFDRCMFMGNVGTAAVLVYNEEAGDAFVDQTDLASLATQSANSMSVEFDNTEFFENEVSFAAVTNIAGKATFFRTTFIENSGSRVGQISVSDSASVAISSSCFVENESEVDGAVFLSEGSVLSLNQNNFGLDNSVADTGEEQCNDIFIETDGDCLGGSSSCNGVCTLFESRRCDVPGTAYAFPSMSPTFAPSRSPAGDSNSTGLGPVDYDQADLTGSSVFLRSLIIALTVIVGFFILFVLCKRRQRPPKTSTKGGVSATTPQTRPLMVSASDSADEEDEPSKSNKGGGGLLVGFGKRREKKDDKKEKRGPRSIFRRKNNNNNKKKKQDQLELSEHDGGGASHYTDQFTTSGHSAFEASAMDFDVTVDDDDKNLDDDESEHTDTLGNYPS